MIDRRFLITSSSTLSTSVVLVERMNRAFASNDATPSRSAPALAVFVPGAAEERRYLDWKDDGLVFGLAFRSSEVKPWLSHGGSLVMVAPLSLQPSKWIIIHYSRRHRLCSLVKLALGQV